VSERELIFDRKIVKNKKRGIYILSIGRILRALNATDWDLVRIYAKREDDNTIVLRMVRVI